jgi:hypothetical protein
MPACLRTVTSADKREEIARPAASSDARTIREPLASLETELEASAELKLRKRRAELAAILVVTTGIGEFPST